ncbi:MAG TPA: peptidoglycan DD-metalloendopeptidase family protein [Alphaproteobacteria bacterium]|nr:peptidoglycan DD-metalloendopeptidase family protein [Alphaproteobacteria bacterium]
MTAKQDDARSPRLRRVVHIILTLAMLLPLGWFGWQGLSHLSSPVGAAALPLEPVRDTEQELPARHFVLVHSRSDGAIAGPGREQPMAPLVLDRALVVERGQTMIELLLEAGIGREEANAAIGALSGVYEPRRLKAGQEIRVSFAPTLAQDTTRRLVAILLNESVERDIQVTRAPDGGFTASQITRPLSVDMERHAGIIRSSLYEAGSEAGVPLPVMAEMIRAMSFDIDFQRDVQAGDSFELVYEQYRDGDGRPAKTGAILYAGLTLNGKPLDFYRFTTSSGRTDFYTATGDSVRKALLRTPVDGFRVSSGFGMRKHPILGYSKLHKGVDFAAPMGAPIYAAGDGAVEEAGRKGAYGNYVRLRHKGAYRTAYAHLSRFAKGMKVGRRVRQGEIIGYVGSTGRSTGPHLHYEVIVSGKQINPLSVKLPTGEKLTGAEKDRFLLAKAAADRLRERLQLQQLVASGDSSLVRAR